MMETFYVTTESGAIGGPYRTLSAAWSMLLNRVGSIVCHNDSGDPDIPAIYTAAVHRSDGSWETHNVISTD